MLKPMELQESILEVLHEHGAMDRNRLANWVDCKLDDWKGSYRAKQDRVSSTLTILKDKGLVESIRYQGQDADTWDLSRKGMDLMDRKVQDEMMGVERQGSFEPGSEAMEAYNRLTSYLDQRELGAIFKALDPEEHVKHCVEQERDEILMEKWVQEHDRQWDEVQEQRRQQELEQEREEYLIGLAFTD